MDLAIQLAGGALIFVALADVFLTVLHARGDSGFISPWLNRAIWRVFRGIARLPGARRDVILGYAGPTLLALTVAVWAAILMVGFALVYWPALGTSIAMTSGPTPRSFAMALYFSGTCLTTLGIGDLVAQTTAYRLLAVVESAIGFSVVTLALTYFLSIYSALIRRNALALELDLASARTGDAAELILRMVDDGDLRAARGSLAAVGRELMALLQAHHSYPAIMYFRRREVGYSTARVGLLALDAASLIRSAIDPARHARFIASGAVEMLWGGALLLVRQAGHDILPGDLLHENMRHPHAEAWRRRFLGAHAKFAAAGIAVDSDVEAAAARYVRVRSHWDGFARSFADYLADDWATVDPLTAR